MSNYTHRPTEEFCTEITKEIYEALLPWIKNSGIKIENQDIKYGFISRYSHLLWIGGDLTLSWNPFGAILPLSDFIAKFKTPTETDAQKRERLIDELKFILGDTEYGKMTTAKHIDCYDKIRQIESLKPKS